MTIMSQARGDMKFSPVNMRQMRWMPPRSTSTQMPAQQMHTSDKMTAGSATALYFLMPKIEADEATMRPPADRPTKNMKQVRYSPQLVELFMPVMPRPNMSWYTYTPIPTRAMAPEPTTSGFFITEVIAPS